MKKRFFKRSMSMLLAVVMVLIMVPITAISINAAGTEIFAGDGGYIGKSYNALGNLAFGEDALTLADIFTNKNILDFEMRSKNETNCTYSLVDDFSSYAYNQSTSLDVSIDVSTKIKIVKLNANAKYGMSSSSSSSGEQHSEYFVMEVTHIENTSYMDVTTSSLKKLWSGNNTINPDFIDAINKMEVAEFFALYGTHIVTGYSAGGYSYASYEGESLATNASFSDSRNISVGLGMDISTFVNLKGDMKISESNNGNTSTSNNSVLCGKDTVGGNGNILDLSKDGINTADVNNFIDSITKENSRIIVDDNLKMLSIWDFILASENPSLESYARELEEYYYEHIDGEKEQIGGYSNDFLNYSDCKIITTPEDFYNIRNELDGIYVLACNIDLSGYENWEPIGSELDPFTGRFYGNSNTISGLNITSCTDDIAGLFGYNNGTIHGVRVEGNIAVDGANSVGAVAAYNNGTISDCYDSVVYDVDYFSLTDVNLGLRKIDLESFSSGTITIGDENGIHLVGQPDKTYTGINIVVADNDVESPAYIVLENANIVGDSANGTIYSDNDRSIYIVSIGTANMISGATSKSAINTATTSVTFFGNAELFVKGGNGITATTAGGNGTAGATAIIVDSLIVNMNEELTVAGGAGGNGAAGSNGGYEVFGGNGGNGGNGGMAIDSHSVSIGSTGTVEIIGGNGGRGGNGGYVADGCDGKDQYNIPDAGNGGHGGNGGMPILVSSITSLTSSTLKLLYGNGGDGGNGGEGGDPRVSSNSADGWSNGGNGGNGGNGFVAGNGGNGGNGGGSYGEGHFANTHSYSGNGGNGGNGGNIILGVVYTSDIIDLLEPNVECGKYGAAGSCGPVLDYGEEVHGYWGSNGSDGKSGITDNFFYDEFINSDIQDEGSEKQMISGILSGHSNSSNFDAINRSVWNKVTLSIDYISDISYFSGHEFEKDTISVSSNGEEVYYDYSFNSQRIGINYVKITDGNCTRLIPVYVTETVPVALEITAFPKLEYEYQDTFSVSGLALKATYNDGTVVENITESNADVKYNVPDMNTLGEKEIKVTFFGVEASYLITVEPKTITGAVRIDGIPAVNNVLTANLLSISDENAREIVLYQWLVDGDVYSTGSFETAKSITVNESMAGKTITLTVLGVGNYRGSFEDTKSINKKDQTAPENAPTVITVTDTSVVLEAISGMEYTYCVGDLIEPASGAVWQPENTFENLSPNTKYSFFMRKRATNIANASAPSGATVATTSKTVISGTVSVKGGNNVGDTLTANISGITANADVKYQWYRNGVAIAAATDNSYTITEADAGTDIYLVVSGINSFTGNIQSNIINVKTNTVSPDDPQIIVENKIAMAGSIIKVPVILSNNAGFAYLRITLEYDKTVLTLDGVNNSVPGLIMAQGDNVLSWDSSSSYIGNGELCVLTFSVATIGIYEIKITVSECYDENTDDVELFAVSGTVSVIDFVYGDANGDGEVNGKDVIVLRRHLVGQSVDIFDGADANGDGEVNGKDVIILRRYLVGTAELGPIA